MTLSGPELIGVATSFIVIIFSFLQITNQTLKDIREKLDDNKNKRNSKVIQMLEEAKTNIDEVSKSIENEVKNYKNKQSTLEPENIEKYRDTVRDVFMILDDARDIKKSHNLLSFSIRRIRRDLLFLFVLTGIAVISTGLTAGILFQEVLALWFFIFSFTLPYMGSKIFKNYKRYKLVGDLLGKNRVGWNDESE